MARRADHSREELAELTIAAARRLIAEHGIENLSARALSREIGYAPGTLYNHFKDLDEIVTLANEETLLGLGRAFHAAAQSDDPRQMLHNYADAFLTYIETHQHLWTALFEYRRAPNTELPDWYAAILEDLARILAECFRQIRPAATPKEAADAARLIFASVHSVSSLEHTGRLEFIMDRDIRQVVHQLVDIHIRAFAAG